MAKCGVVGVGDMGAVIARRLAESGHDVAVYDVDRTAYGRLGESSVTSATSLMQLSRLADLIVITVGPGSAVESLFDDDGDNLLRAAAPNQIFCVSSTIDPVVAQRLGDRVTQSGSILVDAPIAGGQVGLEQGEAVVFFGGSEEDLHSSREVLSCFAAHIVMVGGVGSGHAAKLANNLLLWGAVSLTVEAMSLGAALGVNPEDMRRAMMAGSGRTWALETWDRPRPMPWCDEDMAMVIECTEAFRLSAPMSSVVREAISDIRRTKIEEGCESSSMSQWIESRRVV